MLISTYQHHVRTHRSQSHSRNSILVLLTQLVDELEIVGFLSEQGTLSENLSIGLKTELVAESVGFGNDLLLWLTVEDILDLRRGADHVVAAGPLSFGMSHPFLESVVSESVFAFCHAEYLSWKKNGIPEPVNISSYILDEQDS